MIIIILTGLNWTGFDRVRSPSYLTINVRKPGAGEGAYKEREGGTCVWRRDNRVHS